MTRSADYLPYESFFIDYTNSGKEHRKPLEHFHDTFELAFFVRADIHVFVKDTKYHIRDGDWLLINPYEIHSIFYNPAHDYTRYVLQFNEGFLKDLLAALSLEGRLAALQLKRNKRACLDLPQRMRVEAMYRSLLQLYERQPGNDGKRYGLHPSDAELKLHLALLLLEYDKLCETAAAARRVRPSEDPVREMIAYLDDHYMEPVQLHDLEHHFGRSKFTICRQFSQTTQFTVVEYLQYRRVIEAQKRLIQTEQPILDIALDCGFQSIQHFYRIFKKICGRTPLQYRRNELP